MHQPKNLALVQLTHGVFNMLAQQSSFFGRHMAVAATLVEIGGNGRTHRFFGRGMLGVARLPRRFETAEARRLVWVRGVVGRRLGASGLRAKGACERTGHSQRDHA